MKENKEDLKIAKIANKEVKLDIRGQSCWNDCKVWSGYTTAPKCELQFTCQTSCFL